MCTIFQTHLRRVPTFLRALTEVNLITYNKYNRAGSFRHLFLHNKIRGAAEIHPPRPRITVAFYDSYTFTSSKYILASAIAKYMPPFAARYAESHVKALQFRCQHRQYHAATQLSEAYSYGRQN